MTTSFLPFLLVLGTVCTGCSADNTGIVYREPLLQEKIRAYLHSPAAQQSGEKVVSVAVTTRQDTISVELAPAYPDWEQVAVIGHDTLAGFHLFFVGEPIPTYYQVQDADPRAAKRALKELLFVRHGDRPLPGINYPPFSYRFQFVHHHLLEESTAEHEGR